VSELIVAVASRPSGPRWRFRAARASARICLISGEPVLQIPAAADRGGVLAVVNAVIVGGRLVRRAWTHYRWPVAPAAARDA
jgi:hypothetical protein